jgi:hypothetical protein
MYYRRFLAWKINEEFYHGGHGNQINAPRQGMLTDKCDWLPRTAKSTAYNKCRLDLSNRAHGGKIKEKLTHIVTVTSALPRLYNKTTSGTICEIPLRITPKYLLLGEFSSRRRELVKVLTG